MRLGLHALFGVAALVFSLGAESQTLPPLTDVSEVAIGGGHACALRQGTVYCWGRNQSQQLGDGTSTQRDHPVPIDGFGEAIQSISAGRSETCAVGTSGAVWCWGSGARSAAVPTLVAGLTATSVSVGQSYVCAVTSTGGAKCWGSNVYGQLGDGTKTFRASPVDVTGLGSGSGVVAVSAAILHSCALLSSGAVKCWGNGGYVGHGTFTEALEPVDVVGLSDGVVSLSTGYHSCAVLDSGDVRCWGQNTSGQLGNGTDSYSGAPVAVVGLSGPATDVAVGVTLELRAADWSTVDGYTCARLETGAIECWGSNLTGELGDGTTVSRFAPAVVPGLQGPVQQVAAGRFGNGHASVCAIDASSQVRCWGSNTHGELGDGSPTASTRSPGAAIAGLDADSLDAAGLQTCATAGNGEVRCWGYNAFGSIGDGVGGHASVPVVGSGWSSGIVSIAVGAGFACALDEAGGVACRGRGGQIGDGTFADRPLPTAVQGLGSGVTRLRAGGGLACATNASGALSCWGRRTGDGTADARYVPVAVAGLAGGVTEFELGANGFDPHGCAITSAGAVMCWGWNTNGQVGDGTTINRDAPVPVVGLASGQSALALGRIHSCALSTSGAVKCWGRGGSLGNGTNTASAVPVDVIGLSSGVTAIAAGDDHTCALLDAGELRCWGEGSAGQLGDGSLSAATAPVTVADLPSGTVAIAAGAMHTCAMDGSGSVRCWGGNNFGQLGSGRSNLRASAATVLRNDFPRQVASLSPGGDAASLTPRSSASGRHVVFASAASNLTGVDDTDGQSDVFRVDVMTGTTERVSLDDEGGDISGAAIEPTVSADGELVAFVAPDSGVAKVMGEPSKAAAARTKQGLHGVFLRNMLTGRTMRVGTALPGGVDTAPQIAPAGDAIVFTGMPSPLEGVQGQPNVFHVPLPRQGDDRAVGPVTCVTCKARTVMGFEGESSDGESRNAAPSVDGRYIAFETTSGNMMIGSSSPCAGTSSSVMLRDMLTGTVRRVSPPAGIDPLNCGTLGSSQPSIDWSGNTIAFRSDQALKPGTLGGRIDIFVESGAQIDRVSEGADGGDANGPSERPSISGDGKVIAYVSAATNLDLRFDDTNGRRDLHVATRRRASERLSLSVTGLQSNQDSGNPSLNHNGTSVVFDSDASNLVSGDINGTRDVFQRVVPARTDVVLQTSFE